MNKSKHIRLLRCGADEEALKPIEEQLVRRGFRVDEGAAGKDDVVLAVLSEAFYKDKDLTDRLLGLIGAGADKVLPLQLDDAPIPEQLKNALYARNIIRADPRAAQERAVRAQHHPRGRARRLSDRRAHHIGAAAEEKPSAAPSGCGGTRTCRARRLSDLALRRRRREAPRHGDGGIARRDP